MTHATEALELAIPTRRRRVRRRWRHAVEALRGLLREPDRTELAFEVQRALDPEMNDRALRCMLAHTEGRQVFRERPSLQAALTRDSLARLPAGSFGRAYLAHIERYGLDPGKLLSMGVAYETELEHADADVRWMAERSRLAHDLWHVLAGYGADETGESALLLFSHAQTGGLSNALLALGANVEMLRARGLGWVGYAWRAWRRGRAAVCLAGLPYERLLALPLDTVRAAARIEAPDQAHPKGVQSGDPIRSKLASRN
jgi:ubiquinone biosynthesis protein COQ4